MSDSTLPRRRGRKPRPVADRFWEKVNKDTESGCWEWTAALVTNGYGQFWDGVAKCPAHRWSYEQAKGPIPEPLVIDHLCRNRICVNPDHLEAVTLAENVLRGEGHTAKNAAKTHCKRGHEFDEANTMLRSGGGRTCKACMAERDRGRPR